MSSFAGGLTHSEMCSVFTHLFIIWQGKRVAFVLDWIEGKKLSFWMMWNHFLHLRQMWRSVFSC